MVTSNQPRLIGMVHLKPLPGAPLFSGTFQQVIDAALHDADALVQGGLHALMVENFGDTPFFPGPVPAVTLAHLTVVAWEIRRRFALPLGINVLRNDGAAALAIARAVQADYVRVNVLTGARVTDQGVIQGQAHELLRLRQAWGAQGVRIFADVDVKHSAPLAARALQAEVHDTILRGLADAVVVSGEGTGQPVDLAKLRQVKEAAGKTPVWIGSGANVQTLAALLAVADGAIVGTACKQNGNVHAPVDVARVRALVQALPAT